MAEKVLLCRKVDGSGLQLIQRVLSPSLSIKLLYGALDGLGKFAMVCTRPGRPARPTAEALFTFAGWELMQRVLDKYGRIPNTGRRDLLNKLVNSVRGKGEKLTIISFNYDTLIEEAAESFWYPVVEEGSSGIPIIKPHGSVNWLQEGEKRIAVQKTVVDRKQCGFEGDILYQPAMVGLVYRKKPFANDGDLNQQKKIFGESLRKEMIQALSSSEQVFIAGYSFPLADGHMRVLLRDVREKRKGRPFRGVTHIVQQENYTPDDKLKLQERLKSLLPTDEAEVFQDGLESWLSSR